jgi:GNAT superfamily N-acetyltransferase
MVHGPAQDRTPGATPQRPATFSSAPRRLDPESGSLGDVDLAVHEDLVRSGAIEPVITGGADERAWTDCDLASLAENRLGDTTDPRDLDEAKRREWQSRATTELMEPLSRREDYERCYWLLEDGRRAGTLALAIDLFGARHLRISSLYVLPSHRKQGVGRRALGRLMAATARHGLGFRLDTSWSWQRTVKFYMGIGMWVYMWKRDLVFCWDPWTPPPHVEVGDADARLSVQVEGAPLTVARMRRRGDHLVLDERPPPLSRDKRIGSAFWDSVSTLSLAVALRGWPLVRSAKEWEESRYADAGTPESLAYKITIWEAWDRKQGYLVSTPRIPGLEYPTWDEFEAEWAKEREELEADLDGAKGP